MILPVSAKKLRSHQVVLAGDVGGTKTNLALCNWEGKDLSIQKTNSYTTRSFPDLQSLITEFLTGNVFPEKICLGVAGPIENGQVSLTNIGWHIESTSMSGYFNHTPVVLINDLEATANSLAVLNEKDIHVVYEGSGTDKGNAAIIAPGTGLGEAGLYFDGEAYHPFATEGGHCDFAPRTELDLELYRYLKKKFGHVSWERVISGPGICLIYDFLLHEKDFEEPAWLKEKILAHDKASMISEHATECAICKETMELFLRYLAEEASNLALKLKATGGLYIAGGIVPHLIPILHKDSFLKWFFAVGRLKNLLQSIPVTIIVNEKAPLLGAAYYGSHAE